MIPPDPSTPLGHDDIKRLFAEITDRRQHLTLIDQAHIRRQVEQSPDLRAFVMERWKVLPNPFAPPS